MDPTGSIAISALTLLIGAGIGALIGAGTAMYQDYKDDKYINGSIGGWAYAGSILGGAIAGCGQGFASTVILGMVGSVVNSVIGTGFNMDWGNMVIDCMISGVLSGIGYGVGQVVRYGAAGLEAKALKILSCWKGNSFVNHGLNWMRAGVNIGMKDISKIANGLFNAERDILGIGIEALGSSIPDIIRSLIE